MLIDSHCHLPHNLVAAKQVIDNARNEGVVGLVNIGTSISDNQSALKTAQGFTNVYSTIAIYPHENMDKSLDDLQKHLEEMLINNNGKIVAIGECGIDITEWKGGRSIEDQIKLFEMQINVALDHDLPLVIHTRNGDEIVLNLFNQYKNSRLRGVIHCFSSSWEVAQKYLDLGFYISFSGLITYPSRKQLLETVKGIPDDKFLVETDSPYLPPQGYRGQTNEPKYVKIVAQKVAEVREVPFEQVSKFTYESTCQVFNLNKDLLV